ncbi:MAG: hypothetical protein ABSH28_09285 [Acidobacteriota bacterium]
MNWWRRAYNTLRIGTLAMVQRTLPEWPEEWIVRAQRRRIQAMVAHAYATVPFYRRTFDELRLRPDDIRDFDDLARLPLIDSLTVSTQADQFLSTCYDKAHLAFFRSAGTASGVCRICYQDPETLLRELAYCERDRPIWSRMSGKFGCQCQLYFMPPVSATRTTRLDWNARTVASSLLAERHFFRADATYDQVIDRLNAFRPDVVFSYGSFADLFFRHLADRRLTSALPRVWVYGGDGMLPGARTWIERKFGCTIWSSYQSVEAGRIGFECENRNGYHLNVDLYPIRILDEQGHALPPGEMGEIVVSNLINRGMVLLNYRLGDLGVLAAGSCPCGRTLPLLKQLMGRTSQVITLGDGRRMSELVFRKLAWDPLGKIMQLQFLHPAPGDITFRIVSGTNADRDAMARHVTVRCRELFGDNLHAKVEFVDSIAPTPQGKFLSLIH